MQKLTANILSTIIIVQLNMKKERVNSHLKIVQFIANIESVNAAMNFNVYVCHCF